MTTGSVRFFSSTPSIDSETMDPATFDVKFFVPFESLIDPVWNSVSSA